MAVKIPVITESTAVPLQLVYRILSFIFIVAPAIWWAAAQTSKLDTVVELVKDVPQMKQDIAVMKNEQTHFLAEQQKNKSLGADTGGDGSAPVSLESPASPAWLYSVPKGWTLGPDGKLRKL